MFKNTLKNKYYRNTDQHLSVNTKIDFSSYIKRYDFIHYYDFLKFSQIHKLFKFFIISLFFKKLNLFKYHIKLLFC